MTTTHPPTARLASGHLLLLLLAAGAASAQSSGAATRPVGTMHALEQALEIRGSDVQLPANGIGTVVVTPCPTCRPVTMLAGTASTWTLGHRPVAFDEMRRALQANPRAFVLVFFRGPGAGLTRLVAETPGDRAP